MWLPGRARRTLRRAYAWGAPPDGPGDGLSFEVPRIGVMNFTARIEPDATLLATMDSLGLLISQFAERCRAQHAVAATGADASERERVLRHLATEQAALRRVATAVATETDPRDAFAVVTEEVARLLRRAEREHGPLQRRRDGDRGRRWNDAGVATCPVGATRPLDGDSVSARVYRTRRARRGSTATSDLEGELAAQPARARLPAPPSRRRSSSAGGCGAR